MPTPNPLDPKYAPGAEQSRQDVMVGVTVGMTLLGGLFSFPLPSRTSIDNCSHLCCASSLYARLHRQKAGHCRLDHGRSYRTFHAIDRISQLTEVLKTLTIVLALLLIIGAVKFKLGFSGMRLSPGDMVSNIQVR